MEEGQMEEEVLQALEDQVEVGQMGEEVLWALEDQMEEGQAEEEALLEDQVEVKKEILQAL